RTSLSPGEVGAWGKPADVNGDILQQDKELANVLVNGVAQWWFDVGGNRYDDPRLMRRIGELVKSAGLAMTVNREPVDEAAFVVDESSLNYLRVGDPMGRWLLVEQLPALHQIGAPVGHYLAEDIPLLRRHKLFIFPTSFAPSEKQRSDVDALKRDGHVLLFLYAPGLYRNGKVDEAAMEQFTGIRLRLTTEPALLRIRVKQGEPLVAGLEGSTYGVDHKTFPVAYADDPEATVLGVLEDGKPGLVVKRFGHWTAVFSAAPMLPARLLRNLARLAGVHEYVAADDVVWASRDLVAVSVREGGPRTIRLPRKADVIDLYSGAEIAAGVEEFTVDFLPLATRVFVLR
ncbi:MAG: hypothetical protein H5T86_14700, partial [Armatimonadetes bacterium]|nr:hypothetical protein [Armatimonadota bacterium]